MIPAPHRSADRALRRVPRPGPVLRRRALVLVVVLWLLAGLSAICLALGVLARTAAAGAQRAWEAGSDQLMLLSALNVAQGVLRSDPDEVDSSSDVWAGGDPARFELLLDGRRALIVSADPGGPLRPGLSDEAARLNANTADVTMLAALEDMDLAAAERFVALRGALAEALANAGDGFALPPAGTTGPISSESQLAEMLMLALDIQPIDPFAVEAAAADQAAAAAPGSRPGTLDLRNPRRWPEPVAALLERLTIHSRVRRWPSGQGGVDLNAASQAELNAALDGLLSEQQIRAIARSVADAPLVDPAELLTRQLIASRDGEATETVAFTAEDYRRVLGRISAGDSAFRVGLVNVNTAPVEVLRCLPGLAGGYAEAVVEFRQTADPALLEREDWLLDFLPVELYVQVARYVTTHSQQFSLLVAAGGDQAGGLYARAVIERDLGQSSVIALETCRGIWDDPLADP